MPDLLTWLQGLPAVLIYLVAAMIVAGETAVIFGLLVPGEATLLLVGFLAYAGTLRIIPALLAMTAAAVIGDTLAFRAGRRYGPRLRASGLGARIGADRWQRADSLLDRLGGRGVLAARWVAFARTLAPRLAGAAGLPYRRFAPWNLAGVVSWVGASVLAGYAAGESYARVSQLLGRATGAVLVLLLCLAGVVLAGRWLGRNPDPARALAARAAALPPLRWLRARYGVLFFLVTMRVGPAWTLLLNLAAGLVLLFTAGLAVAVVLEAVVRHSGLGVVDGLIADWFAARRTTGVADAAVAVVSVLRGSSLIAAVAVVAAVLAWRGRPWRADLLSVVGTMGAFVPLVVLAVVADLTGPGGPGDTPALLPTQTAVVTASFGTLAWLLSRPARWPVAVAVWTAAVAGVLAVGGARLYLGWSTASGTATSVLLGAAWTTVFMVAWATRDRAVGVADPPPTAEPGGADEPPRPGQLPLPRPTGAAPHAPRGPADPC
ncbi:DedA family protein [Micromonospora sp. DR5-3]|uniref:DedA family protein n=1 Tax=unclassified Micromonospora TaxID=2617518 RepID=UPI0011D79B23|nr:MULTISPECIES: DedA family protein [unclassified Micromonospora]MCW3817023.1 DedA family protein [Micromonospora sp. DR5-3]TYC21733.1 DedA family protein [Micromonospora sp. MP36]